MRHWLAIVALLIGTTALNAVNQDASKLKAPQADKELIQGTWKMVFAASAGAVVPPQDFEHYQLVMKGDKYTLFKEEDKIHDHGSFTLDFTKSPRTIDITEDQGPNKGQTNRGIYLLDEDTFIVCYNHPDMKRPTAFTSRPDGSIYLFIYKRVR